MRAWRLWLVTAAIDGSQRAAWARLLDGVVVCDDGGVEKCVHDTARVHWSVGPVGLRPGAGDLCPTRP